MSDIDEAALRRKAERRAGAKLGFYIHALVFVVVNASLWLLNVWTSPGSNWAIWPLFGWGIGLAAHGIGVFAALGRLPRAGGRGGAEAAARTRALAHPKPDSRVQHEFMPESPGSSAVRGLGSSGGAR